MTSDAAVASPAPSKPNFDKMPGYGLLARMGKRVLRPGGRELTNRLLAGLAIGPADDVVEFAPGMGATAQLVLKQRPASYTGVERDEQSASRLNGTINDGRYRCITGTAQESGLGDGSADVVVGEAMLTIQSADNKVRIVEEAYRILRPGGRYGIHELSLQPADLDAEAQEQVRGDLARTIKVNAKPLTSTDWRALLEGAGFEIRSESAASMGLLNPRRLLKDEGPMRAVLVVFNVVRHRQARRRVIAMRRTFGHHADRLAAISFVAVKPG